MTSYEVNPVPTLRETYSPTISIPYLCEETKEEKQMNTIDWKDLIRKGAAEEIANEEAKHISLLAAMILGVGTKANEAEIGRAVWIANEILKVAKEYKHEPERPN